MSEVLAALHAHRTTSGNSMLLNAARYAMHVIRKGFGAKLGRLRRENGSGDTENQTTFVSSTRKTMGVATTTDTTDSVRTSFEVFKNLYGMSVQVDETAKSKKDCKAAVWETFGKATPE